MSEVFVMIAVPWQLPFLAVLFAYIGSKAARFTVGLLRELRS